MIKLFTLALMLVIVGCSATRGCTNVEACNYDIDAIFDDGSCIFLDMCGDCVEPGNTDCVQDCNGDWGGEAYFDDCGECSGGNTGHTANSDKDCAGNCFGFAYYDTCGNCTIDPQGTEIYCCDGQVICPAGSNPPFPEEVTIGTLDDCNNVYDDCGVCGGDGESCEASILITDWRMYPTGGQGIGFEQGGANNNLLNCNQQSNPLCFDSNIDLVGSMHLYIEIAALGEGFDTDNDYIADLDIDLTLGIYINRQVEIGGIESSCDDIYGHIGEPVEETVVFNAEYIADGVFEFHFFQPYGQTSFTNLPEDIDLFQPVEIGGTTYTLNNSQDFNADYHMHIYIK